MNKMLLLCLLTGSNASTVFAQTGGSLPGQVVTLQPASLPALQASLHEPPISPTPATATVKPQVVFNAVSDSEVYDVHLRPLYTTAIRVPSEVSTVAVGAPTLFEAEHKESEPDIVFVKPSTHAVAESNILIALKSGKAISMRLISPGDAGSADPVDFVVDYHERKSLFATREAAAGSDIQVTDHGNAIENAPERPAEFSSQASGGSMIAAQDLVGAPHYLTASELVKYVKQNAKAPNSFGIALGEVHEDGDTMSVSFSVLNTSNHLVTIMPAQVDLSNPTQTKKDKAKNGVFSETLLCLDTRLNRATLAPGERTDGSVVFSKPDSKLLREGLLLHIATSAAIDAPLYYPLPFVASPTNSNSNPSAEARLADQQ